MACSSPTLSLLAPKSSLPARGPSYRKASSTIWQHRARTGATSTGDDTVAADAAATAMGNDGSREKEMKRCLRCGILYLDENSPIACAFHGHITGEKGLFSLSPPHQGIDGEWSDKSGVIVYRWNEHGNRPNTGRANWKGRWSCCQERDEEAPPLTAKFTAKFS